MSRLCVSVFIMSVFSFTLSSLPSRSASRCCVSMFTRFRSVMSSDALASFESCASSPYTRCGSRVYEHEGEVFLERLALGDLRRSSPLQQAQTLERTVSAEAFVGQQEVAGAALLVQVREEVEASVTRWYSPIAVEVFSAVQRFSAVVMRGFMSRDLMLVLISSRIKS